MNKKQRVIATINGEDTDCVPASFSLHFPVNQSTGEEAVEAHIAFFNETDTDILKIMNENLVPCYGMITCPADYYEKIPDMDGNTGIIRNQIELTEKILEKADRDVFSVGTLHGICASGIHPLEHMGEGYNWYQVRQMQCDFLRWDEQKMLAAMDRIANGMCALAEGYIREAGVDAVYYAALGAETFWFTDVEFARWIKPFDIKIMKAVKDAGGYCILHMCKSGINMKRYDEDYAALADVVNWGVYEAPMSIEDGKKLFPGKCVLGGFKNHNGVLEDGNEEEIRSAVRTLVRDFGRCGLILGADCTLPTEQDRRRVRIAVDEAHSL